MVAVSAGGRCRGPGHPEPGGVGSLLVSGRACETAHTDHLPGGHGGTLRGAEHASECIVMGAGT